MVYKLINLKHRKKIIGIGLTLLMLIGIGLYWRYKVNYEMIVTFSETNPEAYDFPVGKRKINATPWIKQGYTKLDQYKIYNPHAEPLHKDDNLFVAMLACTRRNKVSYPHLYQRFDQIDYQNFEAEVQKITYLYSTFNGEINLPHDDFFLVVFDNGKYEMRVGRQKNATYTSFFGFDISSTGTYAIKNKGLIRE